MVLVGVDVHAATFLEVNKPQPIVLFEVVKGWLTGSTPEMGRRTCPEVAGRAPADRPGGRFRVEYSLCVPPRKRNAMSALRCVAELYDRRAGPYTLVGGQHFTRSGRNLEVVLLVAFLVIVFGHSRINPVNSGFERVLLLLASALPGSGAPGGFGFISAAPSRRIGRDGPCRSSGTFVQIGFQSRRGFLSRGDLTFR